MSPSDDWPTQVTRGNPIEQMSEDLRRDFWIAYETPGARAPCTLDELRGMGWQESSYIIRCWKHRWG